MDKRIQKKSIDEYIEDIILRGKQNSISINGVYDPNQLDLDRQNYGYINNQIVLGVNENVANARESRRKDLAEKYLQLVKSPNSISLLVDYAKEMWNDKYYDIAQELLGRVLQIHPQNTYCLHILSRINLELSRVNKDSEYYVALAEQLAERGLEYIDEVSERLLEDRLDSLAHQDIKPTESEEKLGIYFSRKYSKR